MIYLSRRCSTPHQNKTAKNAAYVCSPCGASLSEQRIDLFSIREIVTDCRVYARNCVWLKAL